MKFFSLKIISILFFCACIIGLAMKPKYIFLEIGSTFIFISLFMLFMISKKYKIVNSYIWHIFFCAIIIIGGSFLVIIKDVFLSYFITWLLSLLVTGVFFDTHLFIQRKYWSIEQKDYYITILNILAIISSLICIEYNRFIFISFGFSGASVALLYSKVKNIFDNYLKARNRL